MTLDLAAVSSPASPSSDPPSLSDLPIDPQYKSIPRSISPPFQSTQQTNSHMPDTTTNTNTTTTASTNNDTIHQPPTLQPSQTYSCSTCRISFSNNSEQRSHMKESWHVFNIRRNIISLPPVSYEEFMLLEEESVQRDVKPKAVGRSRSQDSKVNRSKSRDRKINVQEEEALSPSHCLFCNETFSEAEPIDSSLDETLNHMRNTHGFLIPDQDSLTSLDNFLSYLGIVIGVYHECISCGTTRPTTKAIQSHMRDKSHCILNFEQEPELLEFWEDGKLQEEKARDGAKRVMLSDTELRLSSGKVITSRHIPSSTRSPRRNDNSSPKNDDTLTLSSRRPQRHTSEPPSSNSATISDRRIARRDEMGLLGVPRQQQLALLAAERKAQHAESAARRETQWVHNKRANTLKHDQMQTGPMAKAKAGLHNLLPR